MVVSIGINERDGGTLYNTQLLFNADGALIQHRRKISPTYHERIIWGQGDGSGLRAVDSAVGRIGQLACWEHHNPLARYALMADGEQIHSAMYPGSFAGELFAEQMQVNIRQHALEAGCFVVNATAWLDADQQGLGSNRFSEMTPQRAWKVPRDSHLEQNGVAGALPSNQGVESITAAVASCFGIPRRMSAARRRAGLIADAAPDPTGGTVCR